MSNSVKKISKAERYAEGWYMALSYLWILFIIPLLRYQLVWQHKNAEYAFHLKQGAILFISYIVVWTFALIPVVGSALYVIGSLLVLFASVNGFLAALHGEQWELPFIGRKIKKINL